MSLENLKITSEQISENGVVSAPDKLTGNAAENKAVFDNLIRVVVSEAINKLIDVLTSPEAAASLGAKWPEGESANSLQEALDAAVVNSDEALEKAKEALDAANAASGTDLSNYVKKTDVAKLGEGPGLANLYSDTTYGLGIKNGYLAVTGATESLVKGKGSSNAPIVPKVLDYAIIRGLAYNEKDMTDTEKASALAFVGAPIVSIGTYLGSGLAGSSNPTKIACNFNPDVVIVASNRHPSGGECEPLIRIMSRTGGACVYIWPSQSTNNARMSTSASGGFTYSDGFISWYGTSVYSQGSISGAEYSIFAIGGNL